MNFDDIYVETTEVDSECAEDASSDYYCCNELDVSDIFLDMKRLSVVRTKFCKHSMQMEKCFDKIARGY
jgi:hypothetical protein